MRKFTDLELRRGYYIVDNNPIKCKACKRQASKAYSIKDDNMYLGTHCCGIGHFNNKMPGPSTQKTAPIAQDIKNLIAEDILDLPATQKLVLSLYYNENLNHKEISYILNVSESRVSQLHTKAVATLKARMESVSY